jgi:hypothetical protein
VDLFFFLRISGKTTFSFLFDSWRDYNKDSVPYIFHDGRYFYKKESCDWVVTDYLADMSVVHVPMKIPKGGVLGMPLDVHEGFSLNPFLEFTKR